MKQNKNELQTEQIFQNMIAFNSASELQTAQFLSENYDAFPSAAITTSSKFNSSCISSVFPTFVLLCLAVSIAFHLKSKFCACGSCNPHSLWDRYLRMGIWSFISPTGFLK